MITEVRLFNLLDERGITLFRDGPRILAQPKEAITPEIRALIKTHKDDLLALLGPTQGLALNPKIPSDAAREYFMRIMTAWAERAGMMTCSTCPAAEAELRAWQDLGMDRLFWGAKVLH